MYSTGPVSFGILIADFAAGPPGSVRAVVAGFGHAQWLPGAGADHSSHRNHGGTGFGPKLHDRWPDERKFAERARQGTGSG